MATTSKAKTKTSPGQQAAMDMTLGKFDDDLATVYEAFLNRIDATGHGIKWKLDLPDLHITQDDLTLGECVRLERESGMDWQQMSGPLASGEHARRFLVLFFETRLNLSAEDAAARADAMGINDVTNAFGAYIGDRPKG